ncbi:MAG: hypothetical protein HQL31_10010, partial [Planctomycetes bacterium]|nr:hypothetical protein [Planctomycetota bacterium]
MALNAHEAAHNWFGLPDLYDYDVWNGSLINNPVGAQHDLMAGSVMHHFTAPMKAACGFTSIRDLKTILTPGEAQILEIFPAEHFDENYFGFLRSRNDSSTAEKIEVMYLWYESDSGDFAKGFSGLFVMHASVSGGAAVAPQHRDGTHFNYEMIQADGRNELNDGINEGDAGDPFPGTTGNYFFTQYSSPRSEWWDEMRTGLDFEIVEVPSDTLSPMKIKATWTDLDVPRISFTSPPGGASTGGVYKVRYDIWDVFGGTNSYIYRDNDQSDYNGTFLNVSSKDPGDENDIYADSIGSLPDGAYYYYAMQIPGVGVQGGSEAFSFVYPILQGGNGILTANVGGLYNVTPSNTLTPYFQLYTIECVTAGGTGEAVFSVTGSRSGLEATTLLSGGNMTTQNAHSGNVLFTLTQLAVSNDADFVLGDKFFVRVAGLSEYSQALLIKDGATVQDSAQTPSLVLSDLSGHTKEGGSTATFKVRLNRAPMYDVVITMASSDTTEGVVSSPSSKKLSFTSSNWFVGQTVTVTGVDDSIADGDQSYSINFSLLSQDSQYNGISVSPQTLVNEDDEIYGIYATTPSGSTTEQGAKATFQIKLNSLPAGNVVVEITSSDSTEASVSPALITFTPANWNSLQLITVTGVDDSESDGDQSYYIRLYTDSQDNNYDNIIRNVNFLNVDDDLPSVVVGEIDGNTREDGATATFTLKLSQQPTANVYVTVMSFDSTEATVNPTTITITPDSWNSEQVVTVSGVDDSSVDGDVTHQIEFYESVSADVRFQSLPVPSVTVINEDDESAGFKVSATKGTTDENGRPEVIYVALKAVPSGTVTVDVESTDLDEGTVSPTTLTFTTQNYSAYQAVIITGVDDIKVDGDVPYNMVLTASSDGVYNGITRSISLVNLDNDSPSVRVGEASGAVGEWGSQTTFTISLTSKPTGTVVLDLNSSDPSEGVVYPANVSFNSNSWNAEKVVTVRGVDDSEADGHIAFTINITTGSGTTDAAYMAIDPADVTVVNYDNESAYIIVSKATGDTSETGIKQSFTIQLTSEPSAEVSI